MPRTKEQFDAMREATKERITAAGLRLFSHKGLAATSIQDIAAAADISIGLMYHYYKSKEDLYNELVAEVLHAAQQSIQVLFGQEGLSPAEKFNRFSREVLEDIRSGDIISEYYMLIILSALTDDIPDEAVKLRNESFAPFDLLARVIMEGQRLGEIKPGNPNEMALLYFAAIQGLAVYRLTMGDRFFVPQVDLLNGLLLV